MKSREMKRNKNSFKNIKKMEYERSLEGQWKFTLLYLHLITDLSSCLQIFFQSLHENNTLTKCGFWQECTYIVDIKFQKGFSINHLIWNQKMIELNDNPLLHGEFQMKNV